MQPGINRSDTQKGGLKREISFAGARLSELNFASQIQPTEEMAALTLLSDDSMRHQEKTRAQIRAGITDCGWRRSRRR